jgi:serine/threonine-protein phosphatase 6 regulatory ankyrin repeat subunit B
MDIQQVCEDMEDAEDAKVNSNCRTALMDAVNSGNIKNVYELIDKCDINAQDCDGYTALMFAAQNGYTEIVQLLLENDADGEIENIYGWTALVLATDEYDYINNNTVINDNPVQSRFKSIIKLLTK